ncbi:MAG: homocysteine S-methyltransferase family protein [Pseudomonadota bacterium]
MNKPEPRYLPHKSSRLFLTDGGLETVLVFQKGIELPSFASIVLMKTPEGRDFLKAYFEPFVAIARATGCGLILESPTWRASPDWQTAVGFSNLDQLAAANAASIALLDEVRQSLETPAAPMVISGCIGPRGDGYTPDTVMTANEAEAYHAWQVRVLKDAGADLLSALTLTTINEAVGLTRAAKKAHIPVAVSFTIEVDGRLPSGPTLGEAIAAVDEATGCAPAYFMINCAHPDHIAQTLRSTGPWIERISGIRANASRCSHAELDACEKLDDGYPIELGRQVADLRTIFPNLIVMGGCCGTDYRHIAEIARAMMTPTQHQEAAA